MYKMEEAGSRVRTSPHACSVPSVCVHVYGVGVCASAQVFIGICALSQGERMQKEWQRRRENGG